jgi:hypothetical protein
MALENFKANSLIFILMKGINPRDEIKGSSPSPGAHLREIAHALKLTGGRGSRSSKFRRRMMMEH